jgi:hypothetical protein
MTFRKSILLLVSLCMIAALVACSSSSSTPPPPPAITVTVGAVPASVVTNQATTTISATVANDSANGGVTWTCTPAPCGSFNPTSTASGANTTWTAPNIPSAGVTLTATSVTNTAVSGPSAAIPVTGAMVADGNYVFSLSGFNFEGDPYYLSGAFTILTGAVTGGEQDYIDPINGPLSDLIVATGSSVTPSADGNLTIVLATADTAVGVSGIETLNGTIVPLSATAGSRTLITNFDASATSSGEMDMQDTTSGIAAATPTGGYAFVVSGIDGLNGPGTGDFVLDLGGIVNVDGAGTISGGANSVYDANDGGSLFAAQPFEAASSTVTTPDTFGRVVFSLNANDQVDFPGPINLVGYIVNSSRTQLVETVDGYAGVLGGTMLNQGANAGTFGTTSVVAGNTYVFGMAGYDINGLYQVAGQVTAASGAATTSGFVDYNDLINSSGAAATSPDPVTGTYAVDAAADGDVTVTMVDAAATVANYDVQLYLDGNGNALAISLDVNDQLAGNGFLQPAAVFGAFAATNFSGPYGLNTAGIDFNYDGPFNAAGPVSADGVSAIAGTVDLNWDLLPSLGVQFPAAPVTGTFTSVADGVFSDGLTGLDLTDCTLFTAAGAGCSADVFNYYLTGDTAGDTFAIETDLNQLTLGYLTQQ